ncbi:MAG: CinA family protein [Actinomycetes bacterium]
MSTAAAVRVLDLLVQRGQTLATAESLTGGLIGAALTEVAGASAAYRGGVIAYATDLKTDLADVPREVLARDGPVASTTAVEMAEGVRRRCGADWGLAVTGVAGPEPQDGHPVGQVFVAVVGADRVHRVELNLSGSRSAIRLGTVARALDLLAEVLGDRSR